jgi:hypothetical protein
MNPLGTLVHDKKLTKEIQYLTIYAVHNQINIYNCKDGNSTMKRAFQNKLY